MNAPIKPKSPITRDVNSSTKRRLNFSTIGVIHTEEKDGEPEVTSRYRGMPWARMAKLIMERND
jgi:hypothetical protein